MGLNSTKTASIFVDTGQLFHCVDKRFPGRRLNYKKFLNEALADNKYKLDVARAYGTYMNPGVYEFEQSLRRIGWETRFVQPRSQGQPFDWAVEIALEAYEAESDVIVLGTSGHEYLPLIQRLRRYDDSPEIHIIACGINDRMRRASHRTHEIQEDFLTNATARSDRSNLETTSA